MCRRRAKESKIAANKRVDFGAQSTPRQHQPTEGLARCPGAAQKDTKSPPTRELASGAQMHLFLAARTSACFMLIKVFSCVSSRKLLENAKKSIGTSWKISCPPKSIGMWYLALWRRIYRGSSPMRLPRFPHTMQPSVLKCPQPKVTTVCHLRSPIFRK